MILGEDGKRKMGMEAGAQEGGWDFLFCLGIWKIRDQMNIWIVIQAGIHHDESKEM